VVLNTVFGLWVWLCLIGLVGVGGASLFGAAWATTNLILVLGFLGVMFAALSVGEYFADIAFHRDKGAPPR